MACSFIPSLLQNNKCTWSQRTPPENGKETSCRNQAQGAFVRARARVQPSAWHRAGRVSYSHPLPVFVVPPSCASPWACWGTPRSRCWTSRPQAWIPKPSSTCGECEVGTREAPRWAAITRVLSGTDTYSESCKEGKLWLRVSRDPLKLNHIFHEVLTTHCVFWDQNENSVVWIVSKMVFFLSKVTYRSEHLLTVLPRMYIMYSETLC